ncbi:uncharacterized protein LOC110877798 [Helianthus annuus]|uniref:uncharacterized protein LOC110877798 n=1 Tax=Helianthus annuus TaxID=4232 RepID=UPI001653067D|nr:uncharacterized protein LOC110877798 [Helianthus annuus]
MVTDFTGDFTRSTDFTGDFTRSTDFTDDFTSQICEILGFLSPAIPTSDLLGSTSRYVVSTESGVMTAETGTYRWMAPEVKAGVETQIDFVKSLAFEACVAFFTDIQVDFVKSLAFEIDV